MLQGETRSGRTSGDEKGIRWVIRIELNFEKVERNRIASIRADDYLELVEKDLQESRRGYQQWARWK
jgi:hypothetical protein